MDSLHFTMNQHVKGKHLSFEERVVIQTRLKDEKLNVKINQFKEKRRGLSTKDYIELVELVLWIISIISVTVLGYVHFKEKQQIYFIQLARQLMIDYVYFYDKELISNEKKLNNVVRAVVTSLEKKGFVVSENDVKNIIAGIEKIVTDLRLKQINS